MVFGVWAALLLGGVGAIALVSSISHATTSHQPEASSDPISMHAVAAASVKSAKESTTAAGGLEIGVSSVWIDHNGPIGEEYPWKEESMHIVDAFRAFRVTVENADKTCDYGWSIEGDESVIDGSAVSSNTAWKGTINAQGTFPYTVTETCGDAVQSTTFSIVSMYVRRELRQMEEDDMKTLLEAMAIMYSTSTEEGVKIYGKGVSESTFHP